MSKRILYLVFIYLRPLLLKFSKRGAREPKPTSLFPTNKRSKYIYLYLNSFADNKQALLLVLQIWKYRLRENTTETNKEAKKGNFIITSLLLWLLKIFPTWKLIFSVLFLRGELKENTYRLRTPLTSWERSGRDLVLGIKGKYLYCIIWLSRSFQSGNICERTTFRAQLQIKIHLSNKYISNLDCCGYAGIPLFMEMGGVRFTTTPIFHLRQGSRRHKL